MTASTSLASPSVQYEWAKNTASVAKLIIELVSVAGASRDHKCMVGVNTPKDFPEPNYNISSDEVAELADSSSRLYRTLDDLVSAGGVESLDVFVDGEPNVHLSKLGRVKLVVQEDMAYLSHLPYRQRWASTGFTYQSYKQETDASDAAWSKALEELRTFAAGL